MASTTYSKSRDDNEFPVRTNSRRHSIATSFPPNLPVSSAREQCPSIISREQRPSVTSKKRKSMSVDLSTSEQIMKHIEQQKKKDSILNIMPNGRRASFKTVGARLTTLLRAKNAFTKLKNRPQIFEEAKEVEEKELKVEELPPKPCFASTLSPEAQYAMMKGYEDIVYSNLCHQFPEYRPMLRRNRTPMHGINVKRNTFDKTDGSKPSDFCDVLDGSPRQHTWKLVGDRRTSLTSTKLHSTNDTLELDGNAVPAATSTPMPGEASRDDQTPTPRSETRNMQTSKHKEDLAHAQRREQREKQLIMTYRYQHAMDILDNLRKHQGLHALSPRVKTKTTNEPLKDYNSWSNVWAREFETKTEIAQK